MSEYFHIIAQTWSPYRSHASSAEPAGSITE